MIGEVKVERCELPLWIVCRPVVLLRILGSAKKESPRKCCAIDRRLRKHRDRRGSHHPALALSFESNPIFPMKEGRKSQRRIKVVEKHGKKLPEICVASATGLSWGFRAISAFIWSFAMAFKILDFYMSNRTNLSSWISYPCSTFWAWTSSGKHNILSLGTFPTSK